METARPPQDAPGPCRRLALGLGLALAILLDLITIWGFVPAAIALIGLWLFAYQPFSPRRRAFDRIIKDPTRYPVPETSPS